MPIRQFRYHADNLGYVIHDRNHAMTVDGGAVAAIVDFLAQTGLTLSYVTHTHRHPDHLTGTEDLLRATGARLLSFSGLNDDDQVKVGTLQVRVMATPGHTDDSVCFAAEDWLVSGDTLFNGTVGNCFSGDLEAFYRSIRRLMALPANTRIYSGHDYVRASMAAARRMATDKSDIDAYLAAYDPKHVVSTMAAECRVNPYLRFDAPAMVERLAASGLPTDTAYQRWVGVMQLE